MKKILSLFLVFTLVFSLSACGSNSKEKDNETESQTETVQEVDLTTCVTVWLKLIRNPTGWMA